MLVRRTLLIAPLLAVLMTGATAAPAHADTTTAQNLLGRLVVAAERGSSSYDRAAFRHWFDADGDCQNTRAEVLLVETKVQVTYTSSRRCTVATGHWYSAYDGARWTDASEVDIDHLVPLKESWESGALEWTAQRRTDYANDLGLPDSLVAATDEVNQSKGDRDPDEWLPPRAAAHCSYAIRWVKVKYRWWLALDRAEHDRLAQILSGDCGSRTIKVPSRAL